MKKFLFDLFPLILFFLAYRISDDMFLATAVAIAASIAQIIWLHLTGKKREATHWINLAVIVVFGGATLVFHNDAFIKWKPTVLYWLFAVILMGGRLLFHRNIMRAMMGRQISLPDTAWNRLNTSWALFFVLAGALNLYVAFSGHFTDAQWVNFKVFGLLVLLILFVVAQSVWLGRHIASDPEAAAAAKNPPLTKD